MKALPEGWAHCVIGDLINFSGGSQPPKSTFIYEPREGYVRLIQVRDYKTNKFTTYIPVALAQKFCDEKDIMIARYGPPIFQILRGLRGAYNVALIKAVPDESQVEREYAYYFLQQDELFQLIDGLSQRSSGQTGVDMEALNNYPFPLPPLAEQRKIAAILSTWDEAITLTGQLIAALKQRKQALMQLLLTGEVRFPEFAGEAWDEVELGEVVDISSGGTPSKENPNYWNGDIPWISAKSMYSPFVSNSEERLTQQGVQNGSKLAPAKAVLLLVRGSMLYKRIPVCIATREVAFNQDVKALVTHANLLPEFLLYSLIGQEARLLSQVEVTGMGAGKISTDVLLGISIYLPSMEEQCKIADLLYLCDQEIEELYQLLEMQKEQKRGLMQQLLTGELRATTSAI